MTGFYEKNVHEFKGKVTIQDIQNEFNSLVSAINLLVIDINELDQYKDRDYSEGSENIPSSNYTLTLGALKKILDAYNGCFIGGTCVESPVAPGEIITFPMLRVSNTEGIEQIANTSIQDNDKAGIDIYYDTVNKNLKLDNNLTSGFYPAGYNIDSNDIVWYVNNMSKTIAISGNNATVTFNCIDANYSSSISINGDERIKVSPGDVVSHNAFSSTNFELEYTIYEDASTKEITCTVYTDLDGNQTFYYTVNSQPETRNDFTQTDSRKFTPNQNLYIRGFNQPSNTDTTLEIHCNSQAYKFIEVGQETIDENCVKVTPIDWNRDEWILNTTEDDLFVNPDTSPVIKVTPVPYAGHSSIPCQTNQGNIVVPSLPFGANIGIDLCGVNIQYYGNIGSKNYSYINTYSPIWIPKGMHDKINPYRDCKALAYTIDIKGGNS